MNDRERQNDAPLPLEQKLRAHTKPGSFFTAQADGSVACHACGRRCRILEGGSGSCRVRYNAGGTLRVPWGYVSGLQCDPIEKKPFYHAYPGASALSFGMLGCNLRCSYCQNWLTTQTLRDPQSVAPLTEVEPEQIAALAERSGARVVASTYNEPLITSEWAIAIFREAHARGLKTAYVSNGNASPEVVAALRPWLDLFKIDLKSFDAQRYRELGGNLQTVTDTITRAAASGFWVEVVTLVVPGFNDDPGELRAMAQFLAGLSPEIPWHLTAFHPDYRMEDHPPTSATQLLHAAEIAGAEGLRYVYAGNLPGQAGQYENTYCPGCGQAVIERHGFQVLANRLRDGKCPACRTAVAGRWG